SGGSIGASAKAGRTIGQDKSMKRRRTPNELMPHAASRCHRDQLVARLEALHTSIPNAGGPMAETPFNHSQPAPVIDSCPRSIVDAREPPSIVLGGSHQRPEGGCGNN